ncbi:MAG: hypothetical protein IJI45_09040 [Anaerolineaceae bacterium]|nr:hypothetical protein [Anaerolineaceae bacterium]
MEKALGRAFAATQPAQRDRIPGCAKHFRLMVRHVIISAGIILKVPAFCYQLIPTFCFLSAISNLN